MSFLVLAWKWMETKASSGFRVLTDAGFWRFTLEDEAVDGGGRFLSLAMTTCEETKTVGVGINFVSLITGLFVCVYGFICLPI